MPINQAQIDSFQDLTPTEADQKLACERSELRSNESNLKAMGDFEVTEQNLSQLETNPTKDKIVAHLISHGRDQVEEVAEEKVEVEAKMH